MVNLFKRLRKLQTMLQAKIGTGAAIFPNLASASKEFPAVTRLHLTYARKIDQGHAGARHFWRNCLPRLKYHNPGVPMSVTQTTNQQGPAALTIYFAERVGSAATALANEKKVIDELAPAPEANEQSAVLDIKNRTYQQIWDRVQAMTNAKVVPANSEDIALSQKLAEIKKKSGPDRERVQAIRQAKKDQERMLAEARGQVDKQV
ncbi:Ribosomal protein/NADH dehydrogenase domain [Penicillium camemberti]|uniref:Ribosomal protein/NADH dehydrogenase domain n=1 Tax=Penicillium camemberti (strain FM 013) TaxID=1429867 RepID=A0A0G4P516_PENC3|nr:Ribosomal protein/NADH dehydrogenase domain [Penicillium camemberti]